ncbi:MAG: hypothetical protein GEU83_00425 [Pseudonocardiaceae bacterium]|nr:hypothetical protein [Pseudonocardiaceae bacterium]
MTDADAQARAAGRLAGWAFDGAVRGVSRVHWQIAGRAFDSIGPSAESARRRHDTVSALAYAAVRGVGTGVLAGAGTLAGAIGARRGAQSETTAGREALAALNGLIGDRLSDEHNPLALDMSLRQETRSVGCDRASLAAAHPDATGRVVLFAHGLMETERWWWPGDDGPDFGARLAADHGWTPVQLRYNTGRHVSDNAAALDVLLDELVAGWPVPVTELALVGHSMGGLIARGAARQGADRGAEWTDALRQVVCLGSPHRGADLEKAVNIAGWALGAAAETRPFAELLELRSSGIKDMRFGYLGESDWAGRQADVLLDDHRGDCADLPGVNYHFVACTLTRADGHLVGRLLGDVIVRTASAFDGRTTGSLTRLGGLHHFDLLTHPEVYQVLGDWLS